MKIIQNYKISKEDLLLENPYLNEIEKLKQKIKKTAEEQEMQVLSSFREELICRYSFSVPTIDILKILKAQSPIIEIGAGNGYWAFCLSQMGADIIAFDSHPPEESLPFPYGDINDQNYWFDEEWYNVHKGNELTAASHADRALFLCWPTFHNTMSSETLNNYIKAGGKKLIYIGDPVSSGDIFFHQKLKNQRLLLEQCLWSWERNDEKLFIYELATA